MTERKLALDLVDESAASPGPEAIRRWILAAIGGAADDGLAIALAPKLEVAVSIVDADRIRALNRDYRNRDRATNVLSFPAGEIAGLPDAERQPLGDIVICAEIVAREAEEQGKPEASHWAHMLVHGTLHLLGYDHQADADAQCMEALETLVLKEQNVTDPYSD